MKNYSWLLMNLMVLMFATSGQAQDNPSDAIELTVGSSFSDFAVTVDNTDATASESIDPSIPEPTCSNYLGGDLWLTVVVPNDGSITIETGGVQGGISDSGLTVYEGAIGSFVQVGCNDDSGYAYHSLVSLGNREPGEVLYIRVFEYGNNSFGEFQVSAYGNEPSPNDDINNAIRLTVGNMFDQFSVIGNNTNATASEEDDPSIPGPTCSSYAGGDLWYTIEVPDVAEFFVETKGADNSFNDSGLAVYEGSIGNLSQIGCDDDGGEGAHSLITISDRTPGEILYARAWEYGNNEEGEFLIAAHFNIPPEPPINDEPDAAIALQVGGIFDNYPVISNNTLATDSEEFDSSIPNTLCGLYSGGDLWYTVEVPSTGDVRIETRQVTGSQFFDAVMTVQTGTIGNYTEIACNDDGGLGNHSLIVLEDLTPGEILTVRAYEFGHSDFGDFLISAYSYGVIVDVEELAATEFKVFPNPASDQLNIETESVIESLEIYNMLGRRVTTLTTSSSNTQIDISTLEAGSYFIEFNTNEGRGVSKFVKQ